MTKTIKIDDNTVVSIALDEVTKRAKFATLVGTTKGCSWKTNQVPPLEGKALADFTFALMDVLVDWVKTEDEGDDTNAIPM